MDKFDATVRRARVIGPIAAFALVASALVVPNLAHAPAAHAEGAPTADVIVADDFTSARVDAKAQGHRVEVLSERTETSQTFVSAKGAVTQEVAAAPVRVRDSSKDGWRPIDLTLSKQPDGSYAPTAVPGDVRLSGGEDADAKGVLVALGSGKRSISLDWAGTLPEPTIDGDTATYADVKPGVDLKVEVTRTGIEQYFVLKERPAAGEEPTLALPVLTTGVVIADDDKPGQTIETKSGDPVGSISPALTWDASTAHGVHTQTDVSESEVKTVDGQRSLVVTPDADFLQSPDTTYPVTIDPSVTLTGSSISDVYLKSTAPDGNVGGTQLLVGTTDGGTTKYRSLVTVATGAAMKGATVQSASLGLWENNSASCTATPVTAYGFATRHYAVNQTWNNQPADINNPTIVTTAKGFSSSCAAGWVTFDVAQQLQASLNAPWEVMTVELRADEVANSGFKSFDSADGAHVPTLTVTYDLPPAKPLIPAVSAGTTGATKVYTSSLSPSFSTTSADPETENVKYTYNVYNAATPQDATTLVGTCTTSYVPSGSSASCAPNVTLTDGTSYWTRATATDATGVTSKVSSSLYFATAAAKPTAPTISCPTPYTDGSWATTTPSAAVACTVSVVGNYKGLGPKQIVVSLDGADATVTKVADSGTTTAAITVPKTAGVHTISANTVSGAQLSSPSMTYRFGYATPGIATPNSGLKTLGPVKISAYAPFKGSASTVNATLQWRVSGASGISSGWNTASTTDVTPSASSISPSLVTTWDSTTATSDTSVTPAVALNARLSALLDVRVCFSYDGAAPRCTTDAGVLTTVLRVPSAFGEGYPTVDAGEGALALATGEFSEQENDVDLKANLGSLTVSRSHATFATSVSTGTASGVFGPGWSAEFEGDDAGSASSVVDDQTAGNGALNFKDPSGDILSFTTPNGNAAADPVGTYVPVDDATRQANEVVAIAGTGADKTLTLTDLSGTVTSWKQATSSTVTSWVPVAVSEAGQQGTTTYAMDGLGRVTRILAPSPSGVSCPATGAMSPGCSWLRLAYSSATTATATTPGDYAGQLKAVYFNNFDPAPSALSEVKVAAYAYDTAGRLVVETNSLSGTTKSYQYATLNGFTALTQSVATGSAPYKYAYDSTAGDVRLVSVSRGAASSGGPDVMLSRFVYNATPGTAGPDLSTAQIAKWGQSTPPSTAYAIFGLDHPVTGAPSAADWPYAQLYYTNSAGYTVDTARYGAGEWLTTATNYTSDGSVDTTLGAVGVDNAIAASANAIVFDPKANSAVTRYVAGSAPIAEDSTPQDIWSAPYTSIMQDGTTQRVRTHKHFTYDEGAPSGDVNPSTGAPYLLPTTVTVGVAGVSDTTVDPSATVPDDIETNAVTKYSYDPIDAASSTGPTSGWTIGQPTVRTVVVPGATDIVRKTLFDSNGNVVASIEPGSSGTDAGTTNTIYFVAGINSDDAACGNHPEWAGLACWSGPAASPESGPDIQDARITYNRWLEPLTVVETSGTGTGTASRSSNYSYYSDGREKSKSISTSGLAGSAALRTSKIVYDATSLAATGTQTLNPDGSINSTDTASLDLWGRTTKYYSNSSDNTNYSYVSAGSPGAGLVAAIATPKGTSTYSYDGTDANGSIEHRGLATGLTVTGVGSFAGGFDRNGALITETMPAGITRYATYDDLGRGTGLRYTGDVTSGGSTVSGTWISYGRNYDSAGRVAADWSPTGASTQPGGSTRGYTYDRVGRLAQVSDSTGTANSGSSCTTRSYSFDVRGDRISRSSATNADCSMTGAATSTWSYDGYARQLSGASGSGSYSYDLFGRQTTIPASDAPNGGGQIGLTYFDDDTIQSITQGTATTSFTQDPDGRSLATISATDTTVNHYSDDSDIPAWVTRSLGSTTSTSRYVQGLDDQMVVSSLASGSSTQNSLQLIDMTGSDIATVSIPTSGHATSISGSAAYDEYGLPMSSATDTGVAKYGWLSGEQRASALGGLQLMGARVYNPAIGRFTSRDSVAGGNENAYNYPNDPVNEMDVNGEFVFLIPLAAAALLLDIIYGLLVIAAIIVLAAEVVHVLQSLAASIQQGTIVARNKHSKRVKVKGSASITSKSFKTKTAAIAAAKLYIKRQNAKQSVIKFTYRGPHDSDPYHVHVIGMTHGVMVSEIHYHWPAG